MRWLLRRLFVMWASPKPYPLFLTSQSTGEILRVWKNRHESFSPSGYLENLYGLGKRQKAPPTVPNRWRS